MQVRLANSSDKASWNQIVRSSPDGVIYYTYEWLEVIEKSYSLQSKHLIFEENGVIIGVMPLFLLRSLIWGNKLVSTPFCEYGGPCLLTQDSSIATELLSEIEDIAVESKAKYFEIRAPGLELQNTLRQYHFTEPFNYSSFLIDLTKSEEALWEAFEGRLRTAIKKAQKSNVRLISAAKIEQLKQFYYLYLISVKQLGSPPHSYSFFENMWKAFFYKNQLKLLLADYNGKLIASILALSYKDKIHWWGSTSLSEYRYINANSLLIWDLLKSGGARGYKWFDTGRTDFGSGVYMFKKAWGGKEIKVPHLYKSFKGKLSIPDRNNQRYILLTSLWRRFLPNMVAKRIGPYLVKNVGVF